AAREAGRRMKNPEPRVIDEAMARELLPRRAANAHKWDVGGVVIVAGSPAYPGAAVLASRAAGRAGAGIVLLATSRGVIGSVTSAIPEVAFVPLPETESSSGARRAAELIREKAERAKSVVIGPGLGDDDAASNLLGAMFGFGARSQAARSPMGFGSVQPGPVPESTASDSILNGTEGGIVVDADALGWLATQESWWEQIPPNRLVLTPHPGEMSRLLDRPIDEIVADPASVAREAAATWKQVVVLKGERTVVSDGEQVFTAAEASPALATAGSGDVLAGTIGALLAQTGRGVDAATLAVYLGPLAANAMAARFGVQGVIATDLPDAIAGEFARFA
ncbi:MAG TPA: ADP/ATP-dependent (S)-NAD(P)H-hydrate dehydratase, partial [Thermomicrobiales bacterium]|nr:ADP/ATP-dependent (S)-NAD(P)H-hydrate dehydratase [Thermomicrobiales bacterium]